MAFCFHVFAQDIDCRVSTNPACYSIITRVRGWERSTLARVRTHITASAVSLRICFNRRICHVSIYTGLHSNLNIIRIKLRVAHLKYPPPHSVSGTSKRRGKGFFVGEVWPISGEWTRLNFSCVWRPRFLGLPTAKRPSPVASPRASLPH